MRISAVVTITNATERQDPWKECLSSVTKWADEIIVVDGGNEHFRPSEEVGTHRKLAIVEKLSAQDTFDLTDLSKQRGLFEADMYYYPWPEDWSWDELPKHLNFGLERATGDWVVRVDADYIFEENTRQILEEALKHLGDTPVATMQKFSMVTYPNFYEKGGVKMILNKGKAPNVVFGRDRDKYSDLCVPIYWDGQSRDEFGVPLGQLVPDSDCARTKVKVFNYDYSFKTKEVTAREFFKFSMAHKRYFGTTKWGNTENEALQKFVDMMKGRARRCVYKLKPAEHPEAIHDRLYKLKPEQFGFNGWGEI